MPRCFMMFQWFQCIKFRLSFGLWWTAQVFPCWRMAREKKPCKALPPVLVEGTVDTCRKVPLAIGDAKRLGAGPWTGRIHLPRNSQENCWTPALKWCEAPKEEGIQCNSLQIFQGFSYLSGSVGNTCVTCVNPRDEPLPNLTKAH